MPGAAGCEPPVRLIRRKDTHRLIPAKYSPDFASVLTRIAEDDRHLQELFDLDHATNERLWGENGMLPGIGNHELVFGIPNYRVINGAFIHASPHGSRFNGPDRGAWYAGFSVKTSQAEIAFHKAIEYSEIGRFEDTVSYDDYLADFSGSFHDLRSTSAYYRELDPNSYQASQTLAQHLLDRGSSGIVYPSVRHKEGVCIACFRPPLVVNVRKGTRFQFTWAGSLTPKIESQ